MSAGVVKEKSAREDWGRAVVEEPGGRVAVMEVGRAADEGPGGADSDTLVVDDQESVGRTAVTEDVPGGADGDKLMAYDEVGL